MAVDAEGADPATPLGAADLGLRLINRLKQYRRIATRHEKRAANYIAMVTLGMTMLWLT